jgi:hypothetical protein
MAKRVAHGNQGRKKSRRATAMAHNDGVLQGTPLNFNLASLGRFAKGARYKKIVRAVSGNPWALAIAGGIGTFFIGRFMYRYYENHPEISEFIQDNFETVESRLRELRGDDSVAH